MSKTPDSMFPGYFRFHRGTLKESLDGEVRVESLTELHAILDRSCEWARRPLEIEIVEYRFDQRTDQKLMMVKVQSHAYGFLSLTPGKEKGEAWLSSP